MIFSLGQRVRTVQVLFGLAGVGSITIMTSVSVYVAIWYVLFWAGVALYALQFISFNLKLFDWWPNYFGYREVQHVLLAGAFAAHAVAVFI